MQEVQAIDRSEKAIALYQITPAEIAERLKAYDTLKVVEGDTESYKKVRTALTALVHTRVEADKRRKKLGEDARKQVSYINGAAKLLIGPMAPYEERFKAELKAEDDRKLAIKAEKERQEKARVNGILESIQAIRNHAADAGFLSVAELVKRLDIISATTTDKSVYMEFADQGLLALAETGEIIETALVERKRLDKEDAERKAEALRLEKVRKEQAIEQSRLDDERQKAEAQAKAERDRIAKEKKDQEELIQAEKDRLAEEQRKIDAAKAKIEADKKAEKDRLEREGFERKAKEDAKVQAEKDAIAKAKEEEEAKVEAERQAKEETDRIEAMKPDKEKLIQFAEELRSIEGPAMTQNETSNLLVTAILGIREIADKLENSL